MSRLKIYEYEGEEFYAYNKEQVRVRLELQHKEKKNVKLIWCNKIKDDKYRRRKK